jgi:hypothetical protein
MSLESTLEALVGALHRNSDVMLSIAKGEYRLQQAPVATAAMLNTEVSASSVKAEVPNAMKIEGHPVAICNQIREDAKSKPTTDTSPISESESVAVTYDDVKKLIIAISKESKDKAVASLQRFGVANGKQLTESTYPEVVAYLTKVLAGEVNPEESHG